jgi:O-antigen ligase
VWRADPFLLLRAHLKVILGILASVGVSLLIGQGFDPDGRLWAVEPALTAPAVGQYSALLAGIAILLLLTRSIRTTRAVRWIVAGVGCLLLSQTRTAMVALVAGLTLAVLSLMSSSARSRKAVVVMLLSLPLSLALVGPFAVSWFQRGQNQSQFSTLTGRTEAWKRVYDFPRDGYTRAFGVGLHDKSINGLPIDSGYLALYHEEGVVGLLVIGVVYAVLILQIMLRPPGTARAIALFLLVYCAVASYSETGIGDMSVYVLTLLLAGSLVAPSRQAARRALPVFAV